VREATAEEKPNSEATVVPVDLETQAQLANAEQEVSRAIQRHDAAALGALLAETYVDSFEGSDSAISKRGALARCAVGKLRPFVVERDRRFTRNGATVIVEGLAPEPSDVESEVPPADHWTHVRHVWLKQADRWLLISQVRPRPDEGERD
jgi:ketosteroid isomerase-like protein